MEKHFCRQVCQISATFSLLVFSDRVAPKCLEYTVNELLGGTVLRFLNFSFSFITAATRPVRSFVTP